MRGEFFTVAGDDFCFVAEITNMDDTPASLSDDDKVYVVIHGGQGDFRIEPVKRSGNIYSFYLPGDTTLKMLPGGRDLCSYDLCLKIDFSNGSKSTPVLRQPFFVGRC